MVSHMGMRKFRLRIPDRLILVGITAVVILWTGNLLIPLLFNHSDGNKTVDSVGRAYAKDNLVRTGTFGATNSLFSGLAFVGLLWTISLQQKQLSTQQKELQSQREDLRQQAQLNAAGALAQLYAAIYSSDRSRYDQEHENEWSRREAGDPDTDTGATIISTLYRYISRLELILNKLDEAKSK
ncbi:MAG: hypothetical protein ACLQVF_46015 [Isosphaeraceae bacterium]